MHHKKELELSAAAFAELVDAVMERLTRYVEGMQTHPLDLSHTAEPKFLRDLIEPAPESGMDL